MLNVCWEIVVLKDTTLAINIYIWHWLFAPFFFLIYFLWFTSESRIKIQKSDQVIARLTHQLKSINKNIEIRLTFLLICFKHIKATDWYPNNDKSYTRACFSRNWIAYAYAGVSSFDAKQRVKRCMHTSIYNIGM